MEKFKKILPDSEKYTEEQLEEMRVWMDKFADIVFDRWLRNLSVKKVKDFEKKK